MPNIPDSGEISTALFHRFGHAPRVFIRTFGCQQNVSDSERINGMLCELGCETAQEPEQADIIIFNTCAVREHAEDRVFGNVGRLKSLKKENDNLLICIGGCMVQQQHIADKLRASYPYVDVIFNTNELQRLPVLLYERISSQKVIDAHDCDDYSIFEGAKAKRDGSFRAFIPIMYGCDNFCSYCVVPLVRGRERSRHPDDIEHEFREVLAAGYKDIMLLGQNVNSYGKGLAESVNFAALLRRLASIEGDYTLSFMTSHPKDATHELFDVMGEYKRITPHIHLPVQSGSDELLRRMNRRYTSQQYLELIDYARSVVPNITFSSDIIIGFPGETREDFDATLELIKKVRYASLFTFIYSKREGTLAAKMPDSTPHSVKTDRFAELLAVQDEIAAERETALIGTKQRAIIVGLIDDGSFEGRLADNSSITVEGDCRVNEFCTVTVTARTKKRLYGKAE